MRSKQKTNNGFYIPRTLPGLNDIVAAAKVRSGSYSQYAEMKKGIEGLICLCIREGRRRLKSFNGSVRLKFTWIEPNRRRDPDNVAAGGRKFILDSLVREGILQGDGWRHVDGWEDRFEVQKENPGVYVIIEGV